MVGAMQDSAQPPRPRYRGIVIALCVVLILFYAASPYYSVWRFGEAIRVHDMDALAARVDFEAVRSSLKQQIHDHFLGVLKKKKQDRLAQFLSAATDNPLDRLIDAYITPEGLATIISDPAPLKNANSISSLPGVEGAPPREMNWSKFSHAWFTSPRDFVVEREGIKLRFRLDGAGWKLHMLDLQLPAQPAP